MKRVLLTTVAWGLLPLAAATTIAQLLPHWRALRDAKVVVLPDRKLNFANSLRVPDLARRLYPNSRVTFLTWHEPFHNPYVRLLWRDLDYIRLRRIFAPAREFHDALLSRLVQYFIQYIASSPPLFTNRSALWAQIPYATYFELMRPEAPMPRVALSGYLQSRAMAQIAKLSLQPYAPICNLYLKRATDPRIGGSAFAAYEPAIQRIVAAGYQVLLTGDVQAPTDDHWLFSAYVATQASIFIGDNGGGVMFAHLNAMPRLVLNVWPEFTRWDAKLLLKGPDGTPNTEAEITAAVEAFLAGLAKP